MQRLPSDRRVVARFLWIVDGLVAVSGPQLGRIVAVRGRLSAAFDAGDASGQIRAHRGGPHFHRRSTDAFAVLVFAGVHASNNDHSVALPEPGADDHQDADTDEGTDTEAGFESGLDAKALPLSA